MARILLNLNIISAHFPLVKGSAPHSQSPYTSPEIPTTGIFWFAPISVERQGQISRSFSLVHPSGHKWTCTAPLSCIPARCPPCSGVSRLHSWAFLTLLSCPHTAPDLVTSYHTEKSEFGLQAKFFLILALFIPMARGNFVFLGHLSISLMN